MTIAKSIRCRIVGAFIALIGAAVFIPASAQAQVRHDPRARDHYSTPHWVLDNRYRHDHYYPAIGYGVTVLPAGHHAVIYRGGRYFFNAGVWFRLGGPGYVVVRPPVGIVLPYLPAAYTTVWMRGVPYYYANDVYYAQAPGGYAVVEPPMEAIAAATEYPPPAAPAPVAPPPQPAASVLQTQNAPGMWYYCESARAYYPYVPSCPEPWRTVPATPPQPQPQ